MANPTSEANHKPASEYTEFVEIPGIFNSGFKSIINASDFSSLLYLSRPFVSINSPCLSRVMSYSTVFWQRDVMQ
jgi:hypothetical protein